MILLSVIRGLIMRSVFYGVLLTVFVACAGSVQAANDLDGKAPAGVVGDDVTAKVIMSDDEHGNQLQADIDIDLTGDARILEEYEEGMPGGVRLGEQQFGIDPEEEDWMVHPDQNANKWELDRADESPRLQAEIFHIAAQCAMEGMAVRNAAKLEMVRGGRGYNAGSQACQKNR